MPHQAESQLNQTIDMATDDAEKGNGKPYAHIDDTASSNDAATSIREGYVGRASLPKRLWYSIRSELTETRGVARVPPEEKQAVRTNDIFQCHGADDCSHPSHDMSK